MAAYKGVLIDLGGVVYSGGALIPGAGEAIAALRSGGVALRFLTNTTSQPRRAVVAKLHGFGLEIAPEEVLTPLAAAKTYLAEHRLDGHFLMRPELMEDLGDLPEGGAPAVVIGDAREGFAYAALNDAFRRIQNGAALIALASNRYFVDEDGALSLDVGPFVAALEYATEREAVVLGKPAPAFFESGVHALGLEMSEVAMIGDDPEFDVSAAVKAGLAGLLVESGKWRSEGGAPPLASPQPTAIYADLAAAAAAILAQDPA